jgi:hypothetical protein
MHPVFARNLFVTREIGPNRLTVCELRRKLRACGACGASAMAVVAVRYGCNLAQTELVDGVN